MIATKRACSVDRLIGFLKHCHRRGYADLRAVSLFSGAGLSDCGYELAGFKFLVQVEQDATRAGVGERNFPDSKWIKGDVCTLVADVVREYRRKTKRRLDLLVATPPCQGMSSSNPSRGKRKSAATARHAEKNGLILQVVPVADKLKPRVIVAENVRQILTHTVRCDAGESVVIDILRQWLPDYRFFAGVVNVADYGVPQDRRRAVIVGIHRGEPWLVPLSEKSLLPWPRGTHAERRTSDRRPWVSIRKWLKAMSYESLSSESPEVAVGTVPIHFVPSYDMERFRLVSDVPPNSGRSAYENDVCPNCGRNSVPLGVATCPRCRQRLFNRPIVTQRGKSRLIKGFKSSYRRMRPDQPASTVTTNSSHIGSDFKIHPWEPRVLSILECADLQTVPRFYDWSAAFDQKKTYLVRNVIGEAFPPYFTFLHGRVLRDLLVQNRTAWSRLAESRERGTSRR